MKEQVKVPFSLPLIDADVLQEMTDTLTNTGWVTTGPKVFQLEQEISNLIGVSNCLCVNSWTSGAMLMLKWFGVGPGDEVIIPAYSYAATALAVLNIGAKPIMVDVKENYNIDYSKLENAINDRTKVIMPVDLGGFPCDYNEIFEIINKKNIVEKFVPKNEPQRKLNRILILSDAAHSLGAFYHGVPVGKIADVTVFSLHSAKNITTGEGGAIALNLPAPFNMEEEHLFLKKFSLNGQSKNAFEKNKAGGWKYDIIAQGLKVNMPDLCASMGLAQIRKYTSQLLPERFAIFDFYAKELSRFPWAILPTYRDNTAVSSCHLFLLRIKDFSEKQRDLMIERISSKGIGVNVHYIPMPMLTLFKELGYKISDYPNTYNQYANTITLPVYNGLTQIQLQAVVNSIIESYNEIKSL